MSNGATYFQSEEVKDWVAMRKIELLKATSYHQRSNGIMKRYQRSLIDRVRYKLYDLVDCWGDHVGDATRLMQEMVHRGTCISPADLRIGSREHFRRPAMRHIEIMQKLNARRKVKDWDHYVGECVLLLEFDRLSIMDRKFSPYWRGAFIILQCVSKTKFLPGPVEERRRRGRKPHMVVHANQIKHCFRRMNVRIFTCQ